MKEVDFCSHCGRILLKVYNYCPWCGTATADTSSFSEALSPGMEEAGKKQLSGRYKKLLEMESDLEILEEEIELFLTESSHKK